MMAARCYVAGPMTGIPRLNFPAFHAAANRLRAAGINAVNPAEINTDPTASWVDCMRADLKQLVDCDAILLLPGWEASRGATLEHTVAAALGLRIFQTPEGAITALAGAEERRAA